MKIKFLFAFILFVQLFFAQQTKQVDCIYCGTYEGKIDNSLKGDTVLISVKLELKKDSVFQYEIKGNFSSCTSKTFSGTGKWFSEMDILFLKPSPNEDNVVVFILKDIRDEEKIPKAETDLQSKYYWKGFEYSFKFMDTNCSRLFFRLSYDCFKTVWRNNPIQKTNCK